MISFRVSQWRLRQWWLGRGRRRRVRLLVLAALLVIVAGGAWGVARLLDGAAMRARVAEAVQRATGLTIRIEGEVGLSVASLLSGVPRLTVSGATLLNPPGYSRAALASIRRVEVAVAVLPLLQGRVELRRVQLEGSDIQLERNATGQGNWERRVVAPQPDATPAPSKPRAEPVLGEVRIIDGRLAFLAGPNQGAAVLDVPELSLAAGGAITGQARVNGVALALGGQWQPTGASELTAVGGGIAASVQGGGAEWHATVLAPDLASVSTLAGRALPPLREVQVVAVSAAGGLQSARLSAGASDLGAMAPGLRLGRLVAEVSAAPTRVEAELSFGGLPLTLKGTAGAWQAALAGAAPLDVALEGEGVLASLRGTAGLAGPFDVAVSARVADLGALSAKAGAALPPLRELALDLRAASLPGGEPAGGAPGSAGLGSAGRGGVGRGVALRGIRGSAQQGDVSGDLAISLVPRLAVRGTLVSQRLDFDAMATPVAAPLATPAPAAPAATSPPIPARLIPDLPLPFTALVRQDADLTLQIGQATWRGQRYSGVEARVALNAGKLRVDPLHALAPGGVVQATILADASTLPPSLAITLQAPGLTLPAPGSGAVELDVALSGTGDGTRALAATAIGRVGVALVEGEVPNELLLALIGPALRGAGLPMLEAEGRSRVRCLALRADLKAGLATVSALALDTTRLRLEGDGSVDLGAEQLDMRLRPSVPLGGFGATVPIRATGAWMAPRVQVERGAITPGRLGLTLGRPAPDPCGPALTAARDGRAGPMPR